MEEQILKVVEKALAENTLGVILFGSYAEGRADEYSDIDIAVITRSTEGKHRVESQGKIEIWYYPYVIFKKYLRQTSSEAEKTHSSRPHSGSSFSRKGKS